MTDYQNMKPAERFDHLDQLATRYFGTTQWRKLFAERYGFASARTLSTWAHNGPPQWAVVAMRDALIAKAAAQLSDAIREHG